MAANDNVLVFILAGGRGERLYPLTRDRAKPAVPFGGIYRIVDFSLSNALNSGLRKVFVLTQYKSISLNRHLQMGWQMFNYELGEFIQMVPAQQRVDEHWYQGTANAIYQNLYSIERLKPKHVIILAGDHIYKMDYRRILKYHIKKGAELTIASIKMPAKKVAGQLGVLTVDDTSRVSHFQEKPESPAVIPGKQDTSLASMGIYVFNTQKLEEVLLMSAKKESFHDFGKDIIPYMIMEGDKVYSYTFLDENNPDNPYWKDVGSIDGYWKSNMDLISVTPRFNLYDTHWPIRTYHEQQPPAKFVFAEAEEGGRLGIGIDSIVSSGCIISGGKVERSVLSPRVRVNSYSSIYECILMEGCEIGRRSRIRRAIIDKNVKIPPDTIIGYDLEEDRKKFYVSEGGIVVIPKEADIRNSTQNVKLSEKDPVLV